MVIVYPPEPIPAIRMYKNITRRVAGKCARFIKNNVISINKQNIDTFITDSPGVPKVMLFTDKEKVPFMFKALSGAFEKKLFFGMINKNET